MKEALAATNTIFLPKGPIRGETIRFSFGNCCLGSLLVAGSEKGICAIFAGDNPDVLTLHLQEQFPKAVLAADRAGFKDVLDSINRFLELPPRGLKLPLDPRGTAFQQRVWEALIKIPVGATASYSEVAHGMGMPGAARAVARACASNTIAIAIPCHRVVGANGNLSGYRWGVERKRLLLEREGSLELHTR